MTVQTVKFGRQKFVIIPAKDFLDLQRRAGKPKTKSSRRSDQRDKADVEMALKRLADPNERSIPYEKVRRELGLA